MDGELQNCRGCGAQVQAEPTSPWQPTSATSSSAPLSASFNTNYRAARIGPTVCDDDGPMPILNMSNVLIEVRFQ